MTKKHILLHSPKEALLCDKIIVTDPLNADNNKDGNEKLTWMSTLSQGIVLSTSNSAPSISKLEKYGIYQKKHRNITFTIIFLLMYIRFLVAHILSK